MPHRSSSTAKSSTLASPYSSPRRSSAQPRTSRMQYSACGACRMRRVRCDLKDQPYTGSTQPQCGNCTERGLRCVDEFADVKAVKLLRRGRRLQQVEAVYGKTADEEGLYGLPSLTPTLIAKLKPEFFSSNFFHRFFIQHPIIDPTEFLSRFFEFSKGNQSALSVAGQLIAMVLVVWGVSFGVNEYGIEDPTTDPLTLRARRESTNDLVREILQLIDVHGILRKPSFDGVRAVMLLLPLTEDMQNSTERLVMHETMVTHVYTLCNLASLSSVGIGQSQSVDSLVRARVFWYTHIIEGITSGLRGGRIVLSEEDLIAFNRTLELSGDSSNSRTLQPLDWWSRFSSAPLKLASVCRMIHSVITGPRVRQNSTIDDKKVLEIWELLDKIWTDFDTLRQLGRTNIPIVHDEDVDRYCDGWQVFIFECHARVREALKQRGLVYPDQDIEGHSARASISSLLQSSESRFHDLARRVAAIIKQHIVTDSQFFEFDSTLACNGCFFAAFLLANESGNDEEVGYCLQALKRMRWVFSDADDKERTVTMAWEAQKSQTRNPSPSSSLGSRDSPLYNKPFSNTRPAPPPLAIPSFPISSALGLPDAGSAFDDSRWITPPGSATSSTQSFNGDVQGPSSIHSSPASGSSPRVSSRSSPTTGFVTPALLHSTAFPLSSVSTEEVTQASSSHMFFYGEEPSSYHIHGTHATPSALNSIQSPHAALTLRLSHPASPHSLISGTSPSANMHDVGTTYHPHSSAPFFDPRTLGFPGDSPHTLSGVSDALDQTFGLSTTYF